MNLDAIACLLQQRLGLDPASLGTGVIPSVVRTRMGTLGLTSTAVYAQRLQEDAREYQTLLEAVVVPESWFFRGGQLFYYLADAIGKANARKGGPFQVLSVPCAAGQEAYSLAIALEERGLSANCTITAIDVSPRQVSQAQLGVYGNFSFRELDSGLKKRYFQEEVDGWHLRPSLRERVRFATGNLVDPQFLLGSPPFDLIFCRNLLIYLHPPARRQVLDTLHRLLAPQGLICTGPAEPLAQLDARFVATGPHEFFLHQRAGIPEPTLPPPAWSKPLSRPLEPHTVAKALEKVLPPTVNPLSQARQLADAGQIEEALRLCQEFQARGESSPALYSLLGLIHQAQQADREAIAAFQKALYLDPDYQEALLHLLLLYQQRGDTTQAGHLRRRLHRTGGIPENPGQ